jgi:hypothetical protein
VGAVIVSIFAIVLSSVGLYVQLVLQAEANARQAAAIDIVLDNQLKRYAARVTWYANPEDRSISIQNRAIVPIRDVVLVGGSAPPPPGGAPEGGSRYEAFFDVVAPCTIVRLVGVPQGIDFGNYPSGINSVTILNFTDVNGHWFMNAGGPPRKRVSDSEEGDLGQADAYVTELPHSRTVTESAEDCGSG